MRCTLAPILLAAALGHFVSVAKSAEADPPGHWKFDAVESEKARVNGATLVAGIRDGALRFDGKDDYVSLGDLGSCDAVTVAFWMNRDDTGANAFQGLVTSDAWGKGILHAALKDRAVEVYLHMGEQRRGHLRSRPLAAATWYHVAIVADRQLGALRLLIDGEVEDETDISGLACPIRLVAQVVGREFDGQRPARYFRGAIDDVRIYGRALDDEAVQALCPEKVSKQLRDPRNVRTGHRIPDENYCDQPYVVITNDGNWLCTLTTGPGNEGAKGQHVVSTISTDQGRTWSKLVDIEPSDGPEASWVVPLVVPYGRAYAFYTYNGDRVDTLRGKKVRADTVGWYAYKYSDDNGRSWSEERYRLPMRLTACDRTNDWQGDVQIFWGIDKPNVVGHDAVFAFTKLGKYMLELGEGWVYRSDNILTERDVSKLHWELLPEGEHGIRAAEFGSVQEEHNLVPLNDGSLYCVYRTSGLGHPCQSYSRDGGRTWTKPEPMTYAPGGRKIKTPRACPMVWRTSEGKFLFWFHNNGNRSYQGRNPVWIAGGIEKEGRIHWSEPEILLYDPDPKLNGMSYPDLIEQDGRYWFTETQKKVARVHEVDKALLEGLWNQGQEKEVSRKGLLIEFGAREIAKGKATLPRPLDLAATSGLTVELWLRFDSLAAGQMILDGRTPDGLGLCVHTVDDGMLIIEISDGRYSSALDIDPGVLKVNQLHHVVAIVDSAARVISFVVDGRLCDGGEARPAGWVRFPADLNDINGAPSMQLAPSFRGRLELVRMYDRYLRTSEAVAHYHAGVHARSTPSP